MENTNSDLLKVGNVIVISGGMGAGKTPIAKMLAECSEIKNKIFFTPHYKEKDEIEFTIFDDFKLFKEIFPKIKDSFIILDEGSGFVKAYKDEDLIKAITWVQHNRNILILIFHGLRNIPLSIIDRTNYFIFAVNYSDPNNPKKLDDEQTIKNRLPMHYERIEEERELHTDIYIQHT